MSERIELRNPYSPSAGKGGSFRPLVDRRGREGGLSLKSAGDGGWEAICAAVDGGIGCLLAVTSDGGALSLTFYVGSERYRTYCSSPDELADAWTALTALVEQQTGTGTHPSVKARKNAS